MKTTFVLTSTSPIKKSVTEECLRKFTNDNFELYTYAVSEDSPAGKWNAPQPVGDQGLVCAKLRITSLPRTIIQSVEYVISIENSIRRYVSTSNDEELIHEDVVNVVIYDVKNNVYHATVGGGVEFPQKYWDQVENWESTRGVSGFDITIGDVMKSDRRCTDPKNWMKDFAKKDRYDQILPVLRNGLLLTQRKEITSNVHDLRANVR